MKTFRLTYLEGKDAGKHVDSATPFSSDSLPAIIETPSGKAFSEEIMGRPRLVICGAGHVGRALSRLASFVEMDATVIDDREEFTDPKFFPDATVKCRSFEGLFEEENFGDECCVVIATRGHASDFTCLLGALKKPFSYIGMIGSSSKIAYTFARIKEEGFSDEDIKRIHAPIGLQFGAETPQEIALAILAEVMLSVGRSKGTTLISRDFLEAEKSVSPACVAMIIGKTGSAPRNPGARMLVTLDGIVSTIGGGKVEAEAILEARRLLKEGGKPLRKKYRLTNEQAGDLGMVCGGEVEVFFYLI